VALAHLFADGGERPASPCQRELHRARATCGPALQMPTGAGEMSDDTDDDPSPGSTLGLPISQHRDVRLGGASKSCALRSSRPIDSPGWRPGIRQTLTYSLLPSTALRPPRCVRGICRVRAPGSSYNCVHDCSAPQGGQGSAASLSRPPQTPQVRLVVGR
jgi:hypothetical protein